MLQVGTLNPLATKHVCQRRVVLPVCHGNSWPQSNVRASALFASTSQPARQRVCVRRAVAAPETAGMNTSTGNAAATVVALPDIGAVPMGVKMYADGHSSVRVWSPHSAAVSIELKERPEEFLPLTRIGDHWCGIFPPETLKHGTAYHCVVDMHDGQRLFKRDPYARQTDYETSWCIVNDPDMYKWKTPDYQLPSFDSYIIYEMHVGSWTEEGTFQAAAAKLTHLQDLGFTAVQLMPLAEFSDSWGYGPRQFLSVHGQYGTPDDLRAFVDAAHSLGIAVIVDIVLNHLATERNELWAWDGWNPDNCGGIFHEGGHDTPWGRAPAFWKGEVVDMAEAACGMYLGEYRCDGLRFDSANDLPRDLIQTLTWRMHDKFPGRILTAEVTPEDPRSVHEWGFDSVWVHSGYFDIIQQHRALGRGHHGGGDWAAGWDLPRLRSAMGLHWGFDKPNQCIKYLTGSHDQVGCRNSGAWYQDYIMIGGRHRYAVDQYGGGRTDSHAHASARQWYGANVGAAGLVMMFMGTEWAQGGWWDTDEFHRPQWAQAEDEPGKTMMAAVRDANMLRHKYPALRHGWANILHEDRPNGVMAWERVCEHEKRVIVLFNAARRPFQEGNYGLWVGGGGPFVEIYNSQAVAYGGWDGWKSNAGAEINCYDGKIYINIPPQCCLMFEQK